LKPNSNIMANNFNRIIIIRNKKNKKLAKKKVALVALVNKN